jgi:DNA mismatch endonuclease (patch repair protein)
MPRDADLPYPVPSSAGVSVRMKGNRRSDTKPEQLLRSRLHRDGLRFRKDLLVRAGDIKVKPDIVFPRDRVAVFVDGCFWHGCPEHGRRPRVNADYWGPKLERNADRDARVDAAMTEAGWAVVRIWEHTPAREAAQTVRETVGRSRLTRSTDGLASS